MPPYHCCFLDENDEVDRVQALGASNDTDAYGEAMRLTTEIGRVSGFEVWHRGNKVHTYKPAKSQSRARGQTYSGYSTAIFGC